MSEPNASNTLEEAWQQAVREALPPKLSGFVLGRAPSLDAASKTVTVRVPAIGLAMIAKQQRRLEAALSTIVGSPLALRFEEAEEVLDDPVATPGTVRPQVQLAVEETPQVLFGKSIRHKPTRLSDITEDGGQAVIEGSLFWLERRALRQGGEGLSFHVTDDSDSITCKLFLRPGETVDLERGARVKVRGDLSFDRYRKETVLMVRDVMRLPVAPPVVSAICRAELHVHTRMSAMDSLVSLEGLFERAQAKGLTAVAITDHGVVQAFPDAYGLGRKHGVRVLYGLEAYLVDDAPTIVNGTSAVPLAEASFVALDFETTSLSPRSGEVIEIGAVRFRQGQAIDDFSCLVRPQRMPSQTILDLTGISLSELQNAKPLDAVLASFIEFLGDDPIVAHNAGFDGGFLRGLLDAAQIRREPCMVDTVNLGRALFPNLKSHRLPDLAKAVAVAMQSHHRGGNDARVAGLIALRLFDLAREQGIATIGDLNRLGERIPTGSQRPLHAIVMATNMEGLRVLYRLISRSHLEDFHRVPRIRRSALRERQGLMVGAAGCAQGELVRELLRGASAEDIMSAVSFYDYMEVLPPAALRGLLQGSLSSMAEIEQLVHDLIACAERAGIPVVAASDAHYLEPEEHAFRTILLRALGMDDDHADRHLRSGDELLEEFAFLGEDAARRVVLDAPLALVARCEDLRPVPEGLSAPDLEDAAEVVEQTARSRARELYGDPLPEMVQARLDRELNAIIEHGYAVVYLIAQRLTRKSLQDGYLVGSRGSVGSSLVATLCGITEVNPLLPHYRCSSCHFVEFVQGVASGFDLPARRCPVCENLLDKDGHDIPFETFMGFHGDKVPDIDLNFSGEYQPHVHRYAEELFGSGQVFRAGTITTIAERTAFGMVKGYLREIGRSCRTAEIERLAAAIVGVKRSTGQHPGGLMIVPKERDVHDFTPLQRPADDTSTQIITTHFDYHSISERLLKLDLLGHDDPTVLRMLEDITGVPALSVPLDDPQAMSLFSSPQALGVGSEHIECQTGSLGLPEFGTRFVRGMLEATKPKTFADLVRISGLSHGTDVWANNAEVLIRSGEATLQNVIATRDDIMLYLIGKGLPAGDAFRITEQVRKGRGLSQMDIDLMSAQGVPSWYVESCQKIAYMFPKAHATAYVMMAVRIAYYKVHYPVAFYATYFSVRADEFDASLASLDVRGIGERIRSIEANPEATAKERGQVTILEVMREMRARGLEFLPIDLLSSDALRFLVEERGLRPPFASLAGLGRNGALYLAKARVEAPFGSVDDLRVRGKVPRPLIDQLRGMGILQGLPETNQLTLF